LRLIADQRGIDLLSAPRVTTKSGQRAVIEIIREFRYPTQWERDPAQKLWIPTAYETRNTGVTLEVEPSTGPAGQLVLKLIPQVVEFLGFRDIDSGKAYQASVAGSRVQPVFSTRKIETTTSLPEDGTMIIGPMPETENTEPYRPRRSKRLIAMISARVMKFEERGR